MTDGPLIVQSDKTVLLEVDHELAGAARAAIAPFAELERAPEHVHTYRITPLALWNARAAGHDAEQVVDALVSLLPLRGAAAAAGRHRRHHGPLRPAATGQEPGARPDAGEPGPRGARGGAAQQEDRADAGRPHRRRHRHRAPQRARPGQADAAQDRLARRGSRRLRRRRGASDQPAPGRLAAARLPAAGHGLVLGRRLRGGGTSVRRRQDAGRRGRDGEGQCDDADPGHQHRRGPAMEARAGRAHLADRGGDRRILRRAQGDPARHHLDVSDGHPPHQGRVPPSGALRQPRLGPDHLRRGASAAGAGVPDDRRPAVQAAPGPDRHVDPRRRPRGRRVLPDRAETLRRAVEGHRGAGLDRAGGVRRSPGHDDRQRADDLRHRRTRRALQAVLDGRTPKSLWSSRFWTSTPASRPW